MRTLLFTLTVIFVFSVCGYSQTTKFRFDIDGMQYLSIKKNAGGFNFIHQNNLQTSMFFGFDSGKNTIDDPMIFNSGDNNTAYGFQTLSKNTTGFQNTAIGSGAMSNNISGVTNTAVGFGALKQGTTASQNIGIGKSTLLSNIDGDFNVAIGNDAFNTTNHADRSIAIGHTAGVNDSSSVDNVYVGFGTGRGTVFATDGYDRKENVMVGSYAGYYNKTNGNVFLGHRAGMNSDAANQLYITNDDTDSINTLIYGQFDNQFLRFNGEVNIDGLYGLPTTAPTTGQYMRYDGGTNLTWGSMDALWSFTPLFDLIYEGGDVGIGLENPTYRFEVSDNDLGHIARFHNTDNTNNSSGIIIQNGPNLNPNAISKFVSFRDGNGSNIGSISGNGSGGISYATTSDRRLKQNIKTFEEGLATLEKINPAIYQMKSNPTQDEIGFIAQELQKVLPIAVGGDPNVDVTISPMTVDYGRITPVLVAAIKEQQEIINTLTKRLDDQDKQFKELKAEIAKNLGVAKN